jgi:hypothetical protein
LNPSDAPRGLPCTQLVTADDGIQWCHGESLGDSALLCGYARVLAGYPDGFACRLRFPAGTHPPAAAAGTL